MSAIIWVLTVLAPGMYGIPVTVRVSFDTEAACEQARATVDTGRKPVEASCEPKKKGGA